MKKVFPAGSCNEHEPLGGSNCHVSALGKKLKDEEE